MATTLAISKVSGVVIFSQGTNIPKYYFGNVGKFTTLSDNVTIQIEVNKDTYQVTFPNLKINGKTPTTITEAMVFLNSLFGS